MIVTPHSRPVVAALVMRAGGVKSRWEENNPGERRPFDLISFSQSQGGLLPRLTIMEIIKIASLLPAYLTWLAVRSYLRCEVVLQLQVMS